MTDPDFEQIALEIWNYGDGANVAYIEERLRQVWNARGAADLKAVGHVDRGSLGEQTLRPWEFAEDLHRAIRSLDR